MSEVCDELFWSKKIVLSETHAVLKHEIKTGILAQIRILEYILKNFKNNKDLELLNLLKLSYETSILQYKTIIEEIRVLESANLDNDFCLT